jgi:PAS domain S-box-containing protein
LSERTSLPRAAKALIVATAVAAVAAIAWRFAGSPRWTAGDLAGFLALSAVLTVTQLFWVSLRHRTEVENFDVMDAVAVAGLLLARPSVLMAAVAAGTVVGQRIRGVAPVKVLFNASQHVIGISVAVGIYSAIGHGGPADVHSWLAASIAILGYIVVNAGMIGLIIALVEGKSLGSVLVHSFSLNLLHRVGNMALGILIAETWARQPLALPLLGVPLALSYFAYRAWLQGLEERDRMRYLYEAGQTLLDPLDAAANFGPFLQSVRDMFAADGAQFALFGHDAVVLHDLDGRVSLPIEPGEAGLEPKTYLGERSGAGPQIAPVVVGDEVRGALAIWRPSDLSGNERALLETLAAQLGVKLENRRLYTETVEQRTQLEEIIGHTSDGIFVLSPEGIVASWNPGIEHITGFGATEALGRDWEELVTATSSPTPSRPEESDGSAEVHDAAIVRKDGVRRWVRYTRNPILKRGGDAKAYVVVARDVTAELESEHLKADFVATVSHELRTPLTPLKGFLSSLISGTADDSPEAREEYYRIMSKQVDRLEILISDLLEVSRIESAHQVVESRQVELATLVGDQVRELCTQQPARELRLRLPDAPVVVHADAFRVAQVLSNLVSNALKYSPPDAPIDIGVSLEGDSAIVSVRDRGEGIPQSEQDRVFDRFYRIDNRLTRRTGGTGLGLYIAKSLVEAMDGRLWVTSRPGEGSTFSFSLQRSGTASLFADSEVDSPTELRARLA